MSVLVAHAAPAHWINVSAFACSGEGQVTVNYSASSWTTGDDGTNGNVGFQYQVERLDGTVSDYVTVTSDGNNNFHFGEDNNYTISGTLYFDPEVTAVALVFTTLVNWNSGYEGGQVAYRTVQVGNCDSTTGDPTVDESAYKVFAPITARSVR